MQLQAGCHETCQPIERASREALRGPFRQALLQGSCYLYELYPHEIHINVTKSDDRYHSDMLSGPICAMVWQGREAVKTGRSTCIGYNSEDKHH